MFRIKLLYKCVNKYSQSAFIRGKYSVKYQKHRITKPKLKGSSLFTFDNLSDAQNWMNSVFYRADEMKIWLCLGLVSKRQPKQIANCVTTDNVAYMWSIYRETGNYYGGTHVPDGTVACKRVFLLKEQEV